MLIQGLESVSLHRGNVNSEGVWWVQWALCMLRLRRKEVELGSVVAERG